MRGLSKKKKIIIKIKNTNKYEQKFFEAQTINLLRERRQIASSDLLIVLKNKLINILSKKTKQKQTNKQTKNNFFLSFFIYLFINA